MLSFTYGPMYAGKTHEMIKCIEQHKRVGATVRILRARPYSRPSSEEHSSTVEIASRTGMKVSGCDLYTDETLLLTDTEDAHVWLPSMDSPRSKGAPSALLVVDEAQFLTRDHVEQLLYLVDVRGVLAHCYGLRADIFNKPFDGSAALMAVAHELRELSAVCRCGAKARRTGKDDALQEASGVPQRDGQHIDVASTSYAALCDVCWRRWIDRTTPELCNAVVSRSGEGKGAHTIDLPPAHCKRICV